MPSLPTGRVAAVDVNGNALRKGREPMRLAASNICRFDRFALDIRSWELRDGDRSIVLQAQPFAILLALIERPGQVVEREDLRRRLWPDGTFVDYEHSLNAAIRRLRRALGDDAVRPRFIETVPRRGYRFIASVSGGGVTPNPSPAPQSTRSRRLAVLPLTGAHAVSAFADGLTEELIVQVARLTAGALGIVARSTSTLFKDAPRRAAAIGEALSADYLLEGSVRAEGDRARVAAWLVETSDETHVWTDTVECCLDTPLTAQIEAATSLARSLSRRLRESGPVPELVSRDRSSFA